jgi:hypothetical protein
MSQAAKFDIDRFMWSWAPDHLRCWALRLTGNLPAHFANQLRRNLRWDFPPSSHVWRMGSLLANYLTQWLKPLGPIDVGAGAPLTGDFDGPTNTCHPRKLGVPFSVQVRRSFLYSNGYRTQVTVEVEEAEMAEPFRSMKVEIDRLSKQRLMEIMFEKLVPTNVKADPSRWNMKTEVFISYRGSRDKEATELFHLLGNYGDQAIFLPRMDRVDMQAGDWLDQLMKMIDRCEVFMPLLTRDYLSGPISRPELDQALRTYYHERTKRVVPVLMEGNFDDYRSHFLGGFHIVDARAGIALPKLEEIAALCMGMSRNPYG